MQKIVIRMPNWLGDVVMSTPTLKALRQMYPNAHITAMCQSSVSDLLVANPYIDEVWSYKKPKGFTKKRAVIKALKEKKFDMGVLLTNSLSSAWWFFRGGVKKRIGFASDKRSFLLHDAVAFPENRKSQHLVLTYLDLLGSKPYNYMPELHVTEAEKESAKKLLQEYGWVPGKKIVGIAPGAAFGTAKRWLPERFRALGEKLAKENVQVVCLGHTSEIVIGKTICESSKIINLVGKTSLRELIALISMCDAFLANDSGPMHVAAALQTPLVAIFGPTDEKVSRPYEHGIIVHKHVSCSPCHKRECPRANECMKAISVDEIYQNIKQLIKE